MLMAELMPAADMRMSLGARIAAVSHGKCERGGEGVVRLF